MPTAPLPEMEKDNPDINCKVCLKEADDQRKTKKGFKILSDSQTDICSCKDFASICMRSVHFETNKYRDILIRLSLYC